MARTSAGISCTQEQVPILPSLGTHAACGELGVFSDKSKDMMRHLEDKCYQVTQWNACPEAKSSDVACFAIHHALFESEHAFIWPDTISHAFQCTGNLIGRERDFKRLTDAEVCKTEIMV